MNGAATESPFDVYGVVVSAEVSLSGVSLTALNDVTTRTTFYSDFERSMAVVLGVSEDAVVVTGHSFASGGRRSLSGGSTLKVEFTVTHVIDDPSMASSVTTMVQNTKDTLTTAASPTGAFGTVLSATMQQSGLAENEGENSPAHRVMNHFFIRSSYF